MKPVVIVLVLLFILFAGSSSGDGGGGHNVYDVKKFDNPNLLNWIHDIMELGNVIDIYSFVQFVLSFWKWHGHVYIKNDCTNCEIVYMQCTSSKNIDYGQKWLSLGESVQFYYGFNFDPNVDEKKMNLVVNCYVDFGKQGPHSKGYFAAMVKDRCVECNWRLINGGVLELTAEDGFKKTYELRGDPASAAICQGQRCR